MAESLALRTTMMASRSERKEGSEEARREAPWGSFYRECGERRPACMSEQLWSPLLLTKLPPRWQFHCALWKDVL